MNRAFVVLQERAAVILSYRPQRNDGYATGGANVHGAVFSEEVSVGELASRESTRPGVPMTR